MIRLICVQTYHGHWGGHSGYHRFLPLLENRFHVDHRRIRRGKVSWAELRGYERILFPVLIHFARILANPWTTERDILEEYRAFGQVKQALANGEQVIVHFMDGEVGFNFFGVYRKFLSHDRERLRLIVTYHQPPTWLKKIFPQKKRAEKPDLIITVGTSQLSFFDFLPEVHQRFIPHGVDTDYFHPENFQETNDKLFCLTVGQWLRDFDALEQVINMAPSRMVFRIVAVKESLARFHGMPNVELYSEIDDKALRRLYHQSHIGLMPLQDTTANNGLLEMMACGLPIIVTKTGSVEDYITKDCCLLISENRPDEILRHLRFLEQEPEKRKKLGSAARMKSLQFSWPRIALRMAEIYCENFELGSDIMTSSEPKIAL